MVYINRSKVRGNKLARYSFYLTVEDAEKILEPIIAKNKEKPLGTLIKGLLEKERKKHTTVKRDGLDELYTVWYKCNACDGTHVIRTSTYCSDCGRKIDWEDSTH